MELCKWCLAEGCSDERCAAAWRAFVATDDSVDTIASATGAPAYASHGATTIARRIASPEVVSPWAAKFGPTP